MEDLAISGRMALICARAAKQNRRYCSLWENANGTRFYEFCTASDPRSGHWPQIDENRKILMGRPHQIFLQLMTPENKYIFSLANRIVFLINIPVSYTGQVKSKHVTNWNSNDIGSRTLWQSWNEPVIVVFRYQSFFLTASNKLVFVSCL